MSTKFWCGANRFEHVEITCHDSVLKKLLGFIKRMGNFKAIMQLFRRFDQATLIRVFDRLYRWFLDNLQVNHLTLDLDSTVMTRYGQQEGAVRGYNPRKPGALFTPPIDGFCCRYALLNCIALKPALAEDISR